MPPVSSPSSANCSAPDGSRCRCASATNHPDEVARTFGVDRRTLHRHLSDGGETFSSIVDAMRAGLAERHLSNDRYRLTEISALLGFSAPSAFTRWFRQRFGASQWRGRRALL